MSVAKSCAQHRNGAGMSDIEENARELFYATRNAMGWRDPELDELAEETREAYRCDVSKRLANSARDVP